MALTLVMRSLDRARRRSSFPEARLGGSLALRSPAESPSQLSLMPDATSEA